MILSSFREVVAGLKTMSNELELLMPEGKASAVDSDDDDEEEAKDVDLEQYIIVEQNAKCEE